MKSVSSDKTKSKEFNFAYFTGVLTAVLIVVLLIVFVFYRTNKSGKSYVLKHIFQMVFKPEEYNRKFDISQELLKESTALNVIVSNSNNPTKKPRHDTILVQPDNNLGYILRPNVQLTASILKSTQPYNFDSPVFIADRHSQMSDALKQYLREQTRHSVQYTINSKGLRATIPLIERPDKILMIGDSVLFGIGVNDETTIASLLQKKLAKNFQIINAGVGGYIGEQAVLTAKMHSEQAKYNGLIYILCQNDLDITAAQDVLAKEAEALFAKLHSLAVQFDNRVIIYFHTYLEYNLQDIFLEDGFPVRWNENTDFLRKRIPQLSRQYGFHYRDWTNDVQDYKRHQQSIFAPFALYVDHSHLSPLGNRMIADQLYTMLQKMNMI